MAEYSGTRTGAPEDRLDGGMVSRRMIAELAGVTRPTITVWAKRHADFPVPTRSGGADYFAMADVLGWLDGRAIAAGDRLDDEAEGATYGQRVRRKLADARVEYVPHAGFDDDPAALRSLEELLGPLAIRVRGAAASQADYLWLLLVLVFVRRCVPTGWERIRRSANEASRMGARLFLRTLSEIVDRAIRDVGVVPGMAQVFERLRPATADDLVAVIRLCDGLGRSGFTVLLDRFEVDSRPDSAELFTPRGVAKLLAEMVMDGVHRSARGSGTLRIHDPYLRGGEFLVAAAEVARERQVTLYGQTPGHSSLRLAGMNLALHGRSAELRRGTLTPWDEPGRQADLILTNPPFGQRNHRAWIEHIIGSLAPGGRAAIVMPNSAGVSAGDRALRQDIVERGCLECVLALPPQLFQTTPIAVTVWFLRPPQRFDGGVLFIDAGRMGVKRRNLRVLQNHERSRIRAAHLAWGAASRLPEGIFAFASVGDPREGDFSLLASDYIGRADVPRGGQPALAPALPLKQPLATMGRFAAADRRVAMLKVAAREGTEDDHPQGWRTVRLQELCDIQAGPTHTRISSAKRSTTGVPLVVPKHFRDRRVHAADAVMLAPRTAERLEKFRLLPGDILCVRSGSTGPSALVETAQSGWLFSTNLLRLRPLEDAELDPAFLLAFLSSPDVVTWIQNRSRAAGVIASISGASLEQLPVTMPPIDEQRRIGAAVAAVDEQISAHRDFVLAAEHARMSLAAQLLAGTLICE
ncbi:MAG: N-6 DNA methylase [Actinomadura sp.]